MLYLLLGLLYFSASLFEENKRRCFFFDFSSFIEEIEIVYCRISLEQNTCLIGESLFTLFAALTYAYHCLMTLMK